MLNRLSEAGYGIVAKVDVSDMEQSVDWYQRSLDLVLDPRFAGPTWNQLNAPGISRFAVGLNLHPTGVGTGGAVTTFVVDDIEAARNQLLERGVSVGTIIDVGQGVKLAFFADPDGNSLGLRQNSSSAPRAAAIGSHP